MGFLWDMGFRTWTDRQTDIETVLTVPKMCEVNEKKSKRRTDKYTHTMFVIIYRICSKNFMGWLVETNHKEISLIWVIDLNISIDHLGFEFNN